VTRARAHLAPDAVRAALAAHRPRELRARRHAAVAVLLCDAPGEPELLFIERARRLGDPWSGHMAFPGGLVDPGDADARAAAERETREEVGVDLGGAELLGRLDDLPAGVRLVAPLVLSAFVYRVGERPRVVPNHEVASTVWVPASWLLDPARHVGWGWGPTRFPGILVGEPGRHVVWGLTYRLLENLFEVVGARLSASGTERRPGAAGRRAGPR
jgi:8-oxo-dGTP pyrophosphatase MutT (NUDIX family)